MAIQQTKAAAELERSAATISSHRVISLLMEGALERVQQARDCVEQGNNTEKQLLVEKIIAIINGLRSSLNLNEGGDIAINLDSLYDYMLARISSADDDNEALIFSEVSKLIEELKSGWDAIDEQQVASLS